MAQGSRALAAFPGDPHSRRSVVLFWPPQAPDTQMVHRSAVKTPIHIKDEKKTKVNKQKRY